MENYPINSINLPVVTFKEKLIQAGLLLFISILSYGMFITRLGFYWDDWGSVFIKYGYGIKKLNEVMAFDRPFIFITYSIIHALLGTRPLEWHIFAISIWFCCSYLFYLFCLKLWPENKKIAIWASLLFVVFPGFTGYSISMIYAFLFLQLSLFLASFIFMVYYIEGKKFKLWHLGFSVGLQILTLFISEYLVGIELLRVLIIYLLLSKGIEPYIYGYFNWQIWKKAINKWLPYVIGLGSFLIWRLFIFKTLKAEFDQGAILKTFLSHPARFVAIRLENAISDIINVFLLCWGQCFNISSQSFIYEGCGVILIIIIMSVLFVFSRNKKQNDKLDLLKEKILAKQLMISGVILVVFALLPMWFPGSQMELASTTDRYSFPTIIGVVFFIVGIIIRTFGFNQSAQVIIALLIGFSGTFQYNIIRKYFVHDNEIVKNFIWQMNWRAPHISEGTSIMYESDDFKDIYSVVDYSLSYPLNGSYGINKDLGHQNFWAFDILSGVMPIIDKGIPLNRTLRQLKFKGNSLQSFTVYIPTKGCMRVIDSTNRDIIDAGFADKQAALFSNTSLITDGVPNKNDFIERTLGEMPSICWCYYFEKAELARQLHDWDKVIFFFNEAQKQSVVPENDNEWIPYVEAFIQTDQDSLAEKAIISHIRSVKSCSMTSNLLNNLLSTTKSPDQKLRIYKLIVINSKNGINQLRNKFKRQ